MNTHILQQMHSNNATSAFSSTYALTDEEEVELEDILLKNELEDINEESENEI